MAVKNVYVSSEDVTLWEQAEVLAARERRSVAWVVHEALKMYLRAVAVEADRQARRGHAGA